MGKSPFAILAPLVFWVSLLFLIPPSLYAGGNREDPVRFAQTLIEEKKYNEAIVILVEVIKAEPHRIGEAEALLRGIRAIRDDYNALGLDLIDTLENNPEDVERAVGLINQMNLIDENPNPRTQDQLDEARRTAKLQLDRLRRDQIFQEAGERIAEDDFLAALNLYLGGLDLQYPEFLAEGYSEDVYRDSGLLRQELLALAGRAQDFISRWSQETQDFLLRLERADSSLIFQDLDPRELSLDSPFLFLDQISQNLASFLQTAAETSVYLASLRDLARQADEIEQRDPRLMDHLVFLRQFIEGMDPDGNEGKEGKEGKEGIEGLLRGVWEDHLRGLISRTADLGQEDLEEARAIQESMPRRAELLATQSMALFRVGHDLSLAAAQPESETPVTFLRSFHEARLVHLQSHFRGLHGVFSAQYVAPGALSGPTLDQGLAALTGIKEEFEFLQGELGEEAESLGGDFTGYEDWWQAFSGQLDQDAEAMLAAAAGEQLAALAGRLDRVEELRIEATDLMEGRAGASDIPIPFPDQALQRLEEAQDLIVRNQQEQEALRGILTEHMAGYAPYRAFANFQNGLNQSQARRRELVAQVLNLQSSAEKQIAEAMRLRSEAGILVEAARDAARSLQLDKARALFDEANSSYVRSLGLLEDPAFRSEIDQTLFALQDELRVAQNEIVVARVRELLTVARLAYTRGDFQEALRVVIEADEQWKTTNTSENQEIATLQDRISLASSLSQERSISEYDPLYPTISQFLSLAHQDLEAGTSLYNEGNSQAAEQRFARAEANIANVLSVKPYNFQARILQVRISQVTQGNEFAELFRKRYQDTIESLRGSPSFAEMSDALTELQVLAEINPGYPGLSSEIESLEIRLGLRPNPLTQARIAESNRLLAEARTLADQTRDQARLTAALTRLEQALELNPENQAAQILADTIRIAMGGEASFSLSTADTQRYQQAEALFIAGSYAEAYAITQQLLQNSINQRYPPLLSLNDRVLRRIQQ